MSTCDQNKFKEIFHTCSQSLRNYLYLKCKDLAQAEDLVQDSFLKLWKNCKNVPVENAKAFLYKVANNLMLNDVKHRQVVLKYQSRQKTQNETEDPEKLLRKKEFEKMLLDGINQLTEKQRTIFLLSRIEKKTYKEIAEIMEISVKTVEKHMGNALTEMRKIVKNI